MIFFLILGMALGAVSVVFVLQNTATITVTFLSWQIEGSLALILFLAITSGALMILLLLFPGFIRDALHLSAARKDKRILEEELVTTKQALSDATSLPPQDESIIG